VSLCGISITHSQIKASISSANRVYALSFFAHRGPMAHAGHFRDSLRCYTLISSASMWPTLSPQGI
jgi:hypothetical protein